MKISQRSRETWTAGHHHDHDHERGERGTRQLGSFSRDENQIPEAREEACPGDEVYLQIQGDEKGKIERKQDVRFIR